MPGRNGSSGAFTLQLEGRRCLGCSNGPDCDNDGTSDACEDDRDEDGVPDDCDACPCQPRENPDPADGCPMVPGDADGDRDVDLADVPIFVACMGGSGLPSPCGP